ncbi:MAG: efflux RND transporter periplasmic adaptor subunit [Bacillota bacterium]
MDAAAQEKTALVHKKRLSRKKRIQWLAIALLLIIASVFGYRYWRHGQLYASTDNAYLNANTVEIAAQVSGKVTQVHVRDNQQVQAGEALFALIASQEYWADANFKETEMERIRPGETATVTLDMYPGHPFHGVVESVSGGAGTVFSLLPPQNATGNWVKVAQRVPVRVRITAPDPAYPLRIGTTATVEVALRN